MSTAAAAVVAAADAVVGNAAAAAVAVVDAFDVVTVVGIVDGVAVDGVAVDFAAVGVVACTVAVVLVANGVVVGVVVDVVVGVVVGVVVDVGNSYLVVEEALVVVVVVVAVVVAVVAAVAAVELEYVEIAMVNWLDHHQEVDVKVEEQNAASDHFSYVFLLFLLKKFVAILDFSVILFLQTHEIFLLFFAKIDQYVYLDL